MTKANKPHKSPEELFCEALKDKDYPFTPADIRLLTSGYMALKSARDKALNEIEAKAINGMIAYVAYSQKANEDVVRSVVTSNFGVEEVHSIPASQYAAVVEYLVDLNIETVVN